MSLIENSGLKQPTIATERGWETYDGRVLVSSRNLLTTRVLKNIATPSELARWADAQFLDIEFRENRILGALEINKKRLADITEKFEADTLEISTSTNTLTQIEYLTRKIQHLKVVAEYEKSFKLNDTELQGLNNKKESISLKVSALSKTNVPEVISEKPTASKTEEVDKQKDKFDKSSESEKIEVQKKQKRKGRFGPKPGWKLRKAEAEAETLRKQLEESKAPGTVQTLPAYPAPEAEILD